MLMVHCYSHPMHGRPYDFEAQPSRDLGWFGCMLEIVITFVITEKYRTSIIRQVELLTST